MKSLSDELAKGRREMGFLRAERRLTEKLLLGNVTGIPTWLGMSDTLVRTAVAGLAAERFRLDRGRWPDSLEQLVPSYLSEIPRDPFVDAPLKLRKLPDGLFIYSVGLMVSTTAARSTPSHGRATAPTLASGSGT